MGFIRGGLIFILGALLLIFLLVGNLFLTFNLSITPENIKEKISLEVYNIVDEIGGEEIEKAIDENMHLIEEYCLNNSEYVFSYEGYALDIPCNVAKEGKDAIIEEGISDVIDKIYYQEYSCETFWECAFQSENPTYLFSAESKQYWKNIFYYALILSLILIGIMFFVMENKTSLFLIVGTLLIISSLPFIAFGKIFLFLGNSFLQFIPILLSGSYTVFLITFILGLILIGIGFVLKFATFGGFIAKIFSEKKISNKKSKNKQEEK